MFTTDGSPSYEVCFSPEGGCEARILYWISRANLSVHVMVSSLTLDRVGDALVNAHRRGIDVKVILDMHDAEEGSEYDKLVEAGVPVKFHQGSGLMHNKVAIIDGSITITGSYNWTKSAENENDENLIVINSAEISHAYEEEFDRIWSTS
jgi:phosphatidylserine/phosphatidylglycerophosphate/cardiolipin synthase-like enzyme